MRKNILLIIGLFITVAGFGQKEITLEDIFQKGTFRTEFVSNLRWMNDGNYFTAQEQNNIVKYSVRSGEVVETILSGSELTPRISINAYEFSANEQKILLLTDFESIYRRSYKANYYIYDRESGDMKELSSGGKQSYATFSPDGAKVAFVRGNNLFYTILETMEEVQVTVDGEFNKIINGSTDWVYEEELSFAKAFYWSPDSRRIAFYRFDESGVKTYNMQKWNEGALYPEDYVFKYPKAGEDNSIVEILIHDLESGDNVKCNIGSETDIYIARANWTTDPDVLSLRRLNRLQNKLDIMHVDASTGDSKVVLTETNERYVDLDYCDDLTYLNDGKHFIHSSEQSGFKHLYLYTIDGELVRQLTSGDFEVTRFLGIDEESRRPLVYYIAAKASPLDRTFFVTDLKGKKHTELSPSNGSVSVNMSKDFEYYVRTYSNSIRVPTTDLYATSGNQLIKNLADNEEHQEVVDSYKLKGKEFFKFSTEGGVELNGYMIKPTDFDENKEYPALMFQYSGPGSQQVSNRWVGGRDFWHYMLAQKGYIIAVVDPRGTGYRGEEFKKLTYGQLGKYESEDQIAAAKYIAGLSYTNADRIGIWGWSYGGYMSSLCLFKGADVFKMAIAVAPVTNWRYYDTIYTERYMGLPQENGSGYDDNSPTAHASKLKGNFLLIHGTGDDNVHFQNAVALQNKLISEGKQFQSFYYPDRAHGIRRGGATMHIYRLMTDYILNNL